MYVEQLYTACLSEAAYYIESNGECAIIDPLRDIDGYLALAKSRNTIIKYIFETHFHADFVSGHIDLSKKTNAPIIYGPEAKTRFDIINAKDGEEFSLGAVKIKALHTPGHTLESTCYLLINEKDEHHAIFTGDTLFVGDVGRPDLFGGVLSSEELASMLYDSLEKKIKTLGDHVIVYPAHGAGSSCGKNLGKETFSTIGEQKLNNYALKSESKEAFIEEVTTGLNTPPPYFPLNAAINKNGYESIDNVMIKGLKALSIKDFKELAATDCIILDSRNATIFTLGFIANSISIGLEGRFAEWIGNLLPMDKPLLLVTPLGQEKETITRLARVGYDNILGHLNGGFESWQAAGEEIDMIIDIEPDELLMDRYHDEKMMIMDVRKELEYEAGYVDIAELYPLQNFMDPLKMSFVDDQEHNIYVHCAGGYRSVIACSILKKQGFHNLRNVLGGFVKIKEVEGMPLLRTSKKTV
jgi:hydroxyacylglutathione hydrolase